MPCMRYKNKVEYMKGNMTADNPHYKYEKLFRRIATEKSKRGNPYHGKEKNNPYHEKNMNPTHKGGY